jgi:hypothetical protein
LERTAHVSGLSINAIRQLEASGTKKSNLFLVSGGAGASQYVFRVVLLRGEIVDTVWDSSVLSADDSCGSGEDTAFGVDGRGRLWGCAAGRLTAGGGELIVRAGEIAGSGAKFRTKVTLQLDPSAMNALAADLGMPGGQMIEDQRGNPLFVVHWGQHLEVLDLSELKRVGRFQPDDGAVGGIRWDAGHRLLWTSVQTPSGLSWRAFTPEQIRETPGHARRWDAAAEITQGTGENWTPIFPTAGSPLLRWPGKKGVSRPALEVVRTGAGPRTSLKKVEIPEGRILGVSPSGRTVLLKNAAKADEVEILDLSN